MEFDQRSEDINSVSFKFGNIYLFRHDFYLKFECDFCGKQYKNIKDFLQDSLSHILDTWKVNSQVLLDKALKNCDDFILPEVKIKEEAISSDDEDEFLPCTSPAKIQNSGQIILKDLCVKEESKLEETAELLSTSSSRIVKKSFICEKCGEGFERQIQLRLHEVSHVNEEDFICSICHQRFNNRNSLIAHKRRHFNGRLNEIIEIKPTIDIKDLQAGIKPFKCDECGKTFNYRKTLVQHQKLHSDIYEYPCHYCEKQFKQFSGLHGHIKNAHKRKTGKLSVIIHGIDT